MRIITNPGSNLDEDEAHDFDIDVMPQKIVVDGISHDTRNDIGNFEKIDRWVKSAQRHPSVQGTTGAEFAETFARLGKTDPELLVVATSKRLIGSHDAAVAASSKLSGLKIEIVDTLVTDVGAGLCTLAAVQARKAGVPMKDIAKFVRAFAERGRNVITVTTLDNLIKGGRASALQGFMANMLNVRPLISIVDGAPSSVGRISAKHDRAQKAEEYLTSRIDPGAAVWVGVAHGGAPDVADALVKRLRDKYRVEYALVRPLSTSIYLHGGPGSVMSFVYPLDGLSFRPTPP
ncbi:MAG: DegV family protein [Archangium sp.]